MNLVHGVDVSLYEPHVNWRALRLQGYKFAFIRATSGTGYVDSKFAAHWSGARAEGILRGAYHYLFGGEDAKRQADLFIKTVGADKGELPPIVDLEDAYNENVPNSKLISTCKSVLDLIEKAFGRKPMVYSRRTYLDDRFRINGKTPTWAKEYDIWVAQYPYKFDPAFMPNSNMPMQPAGWKSWKFWQYSETAMVDGVVDNANLPTRIDLNWFSGTEAELYQFANIEMMVETENTYTVKADDTFKAIAESFGLSISELLDANPQLLKTGSKLKIPGRISLPTVPVDEETPTPTPPAIALKDHKVASGENLSTIAKKYRTTVEILLELNPTIKNKDRINKDQIIKVPAS